jgi:hypothetical protein
MDKICPVSLFPFDEMSSTINFCPVKKIITIQFDSFRWHAASVEWQLSAILQTFLRTDKNIGTRTRHLLWFLRNGSLLTRVELVASLLVLQAEQLFGRGQKMDYPGPRKSFNPSFLWRISLIVGARVRKCCATTRALVKGHFWRNTASYGPRSRAAAQCGRHPDRISRRFSTSGTSIDLRLAVRISSECDYEFLMDLFWAPVLHPEICDEESLFLFLHSSSITYFVNLINPEPFILFGNSISRRSWPWFRLHGRRLWYGKYESAWKAARGEIAGGPGTFFTPCHVDADQSRSSIGWLGPFTCKVVRIVCEKYRELSICLYGRASIQPNSFGGRKSCFYHLLWARSVPFPYYRAPSRWSQIISYSVFKWNQLPSPVRKESKPGCLGHERWCNIWLPNRCCSSFALRRPCKEVILNTSKQNPFWPNDCESWTAF